MVASKHTKKVSLMTKSSNAQVVCIIGAQIEKKKYNKNVID